MPLIEKKDIKTCKTCKKSDFISKQDQKSINYEKPETIVYQEYFGWTGKYIECKNCLQKAWSKLQANRKGKQIVFWKDLKPRLEFIAKGVKQLEDIVLTEIEFKKSKYIDCSACNFALSSNKCYLIKKNYYCWRDGEIIETYFKQLQGLESKEEIRAIFTMRRYSLKDNCFGRWLIEAVLDEFGKRYCAECVFLNYYMNRNRWGNKKEEFVPCFVSVKILQTDFVIDETIRSSVSYYCKEHCLEWLKEMNNSRADVIGYEQNVIEKMESKILELSGTNTKKSGGF